MISYLTRPLRVHSLREARIWQLAGGTGCLAGVAILTVAARWHGITLLSLTALGTYIMGSFMLLGGLMAFLTGRVLHDVAVGLTHREAVAWRVLGWISAGGGAGALVVATSLGGWAPPLDRLATALTGGFTILFGMVCLSVGRILHYTAVERPEEAPARERASQAAAKA